MCSAQFFWDDMEDEVTLTAFRMTIKDLLALYTAINEGVINILGECPSGSSCIELRLSLFFCIFMAPRAHLSSPFLALRTLL